MKLVPERRTLEKLNKNFCTSNSCNMPKKTQQITSNNLETPTKTESRKWVSNNESYRDIVVSYTFHADVMFNEMQATEDRILERVLVGADDQVCCSRVCHAAPLMRSFALRAGRVLLDC